MGPFIHRSESIIAIHSAHSPASLLTYIPRSPFSNPSLFHLFIDTRIHLALLSVHPRARERFAPACLALES